MRYLADRTMTILFYYFYTANYTNSWNGTVWVINSVGSIPCSSKSAHPQEMFDPNMRSLVQAVAPASN